LREVLVKFAHKESLDLMKTLIEEFEKLAKNSPYPWIYWGNYYSISGDLEKAITAYQEAKKYDYIGSYSSLDQVIETLREDLRAKRT